MPDRASVEQLMTDLSRVGKSAAALRHAAPLLHPGVESAALPLLFALSTRSMRVGELADLVRSDISTVSRQLGPLVSQGLVAKQSDPQDRRALLLELTPAGREIADRLRDQRCAVLSTVLQDWPDDKLAAVSHLLTDLADTLDDALRHPDELRRRLPAPVTL